MKRLYSIIALVLLLAPVISFAVEKPEPRILVALYDSRWESTPRSSQIHRFLEMPANHLGFDIHYYDISATLPTLGDDVAAIVIWFDSGIEVPDTNTYFTWLENAQAAGKKLIILENSGLGDKDRNNATILKRWNNILGHIGLQNDSRWYQATYGAHVTYADKDMIGFERKVQSPLPPLTGMHVLAGSAATSHLRVALHQGEDEENFDLVATSPQGGYIAPGYVIFEGDKGKVEVDPWIADPFFLWYVNPFTFLAKALDVHLYPIPDVTTLDGKRIFYSHIDGDGWNNLSEIHANDARSPLSAEVIYNEILKPYTDFAFSVALITADIDPDCYGVEGAEDIARQIFALPNVEPSSHTYSHPLFWEFFENYDPAMEAPFLNRYPPRPKQKFSITETIKEQMYGTVWPKTTHPDSKPDSKKPEPIKPLVKRGSNEASVAFILEKYYDTPRSYACSPFDLNQEIVGSINRVNELVPPGKKAKLIQWSGDTSPFEAALALTRKTGLLNLNGGDSRFDAEYPSYSFVAPIGLQVGKERQIYASNSNEDTYTDLWTDRFFGYRYLQTTAFNTESPIRVSPFNIYFHIFSGEKQASLNAIKENLEYARKQDIIHITASDYAAIAEGFYSTNITKTAENSWSIRNRGNLQTLRFDVPGDMNVDFSLSKGVIGERLFQNNLYVALDSSVEPVLVSLRKNDTKNLSTKIPYFIDSTWQLNNAQYVGNKVSFDAQGYGHGAMTWKMPTKGTYLVKTSQKIEAKVISFEKQVIVKDDGILSVLIDTVDALSPLNISISPAQSSN